MLSAWGGAYLREMSGEARNDDKLSVLERDWFAAMRRACAVMHDWTKLDSRSWFESKNEIKS